MWNTKQDNTFNSTIITLESHDINDFDILVYYYFCCVNCLFSERKRRDEGRNRESMLL